MCRENAAATQSFCKRWKRHESASLTASVLFSFALAGKGDRGDRNDRGDRGDRFDRNDRGDRFDNGGGFRDRFDRDREGGEDSLLMQFPWLITRN